jgi:hypothetical protein
MMKGLPHGPDVAERSPAIKNGVTNLSRLLDQASRDPSLLLAREFVTEAQESLAQGNSGAARRSLAAARLALRLGGHDSRLGGLELPTEERGAPPLSSDPPAPPIPRTPV